MFTGSNYATRISLPICNLHEHHVPALIRNGTVASGTGQLARRDVLCLLILRSVKGELVWATGEEDFVLWDDNGPCMKMDRHQHA